ncbi:MAG: prepilin-type N-terminal cleavage/methylation domain-containing protein [Deltaproteobacteria bacterium]|jgi:prepilin-type N-terminal cleavage/methylation domain-containing protein|nr:prepilin-type N-terminal cleavage/methylation domain-containing protein [Deltaproteobacteria bacterium]
MSANPGDADSGVFKFFARFDSKPEEGNDNQRSEIPSGFPGGNPSGFSLVELMVAVLLSLVVSGVAFSLHRLNSGYFLREEARIAQHRNMRAALFAVGRDVRMAGNGLGLFGPDLKLVQIYSPTREVPDTKAKSPPTKTVATPGFFSHSDSLTGKAGARAIYGADGGADFSDTVTVFRANVESGIPLGAVVNHKPGGSILETDRPVPETSVKPGDILAVGNASECWLVELDNFTVKGGTVPNLPIKRGGRFTNPKNPVIPATDINGYHVYNFRDVSFVTYYVDEEKQRLMADYHDVSRTRHDDATRKSTAVADNVEDLQIYWFYDADAVDNNLTGADPGMSSAVLDTRGVKAATVGVTSRSPMGRGPKTSARPALFNRKAGAKKDNFFRSTLVETVYLRNFH